MLNKFVYYAYKKPGVSPAFFVSPLDAILTKKEYILTLAYDVYSPCHVIYT